VIDMTADAIHARFSRYYDELHGFKDYRGQTERLVHAIREMSPDARTLLEVACGTGLFTAELSKTFEVEGLDISEDMLAVARSKLPHVRFARGDMLDFDLGRRFDVVACLFSSIAYARDEHELTSAIECMARHVRPGGVLAIEPFFTPETYWTDKVFMNLVREDELKISWIYTTKRLGDTAILDYHFTVGTPDGVEHFTEHHELELFGPQAFDRALARSCSRWSHDPVGHAGRGLYLGVVRS
jgi:ubiquinone/menaquinone biosynthesis C-methylase UbiE